ncbi:MAG: HAMP domain-containing histidine kinase [Oscillospiraceae bacterium]|nr:HAMP domain-containing histidine kinase [Oscillospiraceae bacterium]
MRNNDEWLYLRKCLLTALIVVASVLVVVWVFDTMFNGSLLDFFAMTTASLIGRPSRSELLGYGLIVLILIVMTGVVASYRTFMTQHDLYRQAKAEAERARLAAQTEAQRKSDLITYLAHDLKTPLASVIAYLNLLEESPDLALEQRAKHIGVALNKACRLEQLIEELFEIIRFNLQTITLNEERVNLKFMLEQLADEFYPILLPGGKSIAVTCEEGLAIRADPDKLARVFNNILKNAVAYSYNNTTIDIGVSNDNGGVSVTFANVGGAIPKHRQDAIFEKFYRLDASRASGTGGAGLGLAIAKEIVEAHGGSISVSSNENRTVFTVKMNRIALA